MNQKTIREELDEAESRFANDPTANKDNPEFAAQMTDLMSRVRDTALAAGFTDGQLTLAGYVTEHADECIDTVARLARCAKLYMEPFKDVLLPMARGVYEAHRIGNAINQLLGLTDKRLYAANAQLLNEGPQALVDTSVKMVDDMPMLDMLRSLCSAMESKMPLTEKDGYTGTSTRPELLSMSVAFKNGMINDVRHLTIVTLLSESRENAKPVADLLAYLIRMCKDSNQVRQITGSINFSRFDNEKIVALQELQNAATYVAEHGEWQGFDVVASMARMDAEGEAA